LETPVIAMQRAVGLGHPVACRGAVRPLWRPLETLGARRVVKHGQRLEPL
jgi:hypothetical protein